MPTLALSNQSGAQVEAKRVCRICSTTWSTAPSYVCAQLQELQMSKPCCHHIAFDAAKCLQVGQALNLHRSGSCAPIMAICNGSAAAIAERERTGQRCGDMAMPLRNVASVTHLSARSALYATLKHTYSD
jgi:hypothetical protein